MKDYRSYMLGALFVLVLIGIWTLIARLAKQPIDSSTQNEQRMEIDDVQSALAKDGRIDLNMLQWTREPERCEIKGDTIAIITKPHADHGKVSRRNTSLNASVKISSLNTSHGSYEKRQADESEFSRIYNEKDK